MSSSRTATPTLLTAAFGVSLAQTIVVAALPVFGRELHTTGTTITWLLTGFMLVSAVATPIAGRLGDLLGYRRVLIACLLIFLTGTVLAAVANSNGWFPGVLTGRLLQGIGGGVFPMVFGLARTVVPAARLRPVIAMISAIFGVGGALGIVLAGPITDWLGTSALFWCTAIVAAASLAGALNLPAPRAESATPAGISGSLDVLRSRALITVNLATIVISVAMFASVALLPQLLEGALGASPTETGIAMIPMAVLMLAAGRVSAHLPARTSFQLGAALAAVAFVLLAVAHHHVWQTYLAGAVIGAAYGLAYSSLGHLVMDAAPAEHTGAATGVNTILRTLGAAIGAQLSAVILTGTPTDSRYVAAFLTFAAVGLVALITAFTIRRATAQPAGVNV
ncbi:MFS transporter [Kribbella sp. NBC_01505]|uniref:MFS transporter n=1 Tax=Kribbella sp. NBC_01505 TaxID=2903580 RepID=UPI003870D5ED